MGSSMGLVCLRVVVVLVLVLVLGVVRWKKKLKKLNPLMHVIPGSGPPHW